VLAVPAQPEKLARVPKEGSQRKAMCETGAGPQSHEQGSQDRHAGRQTVTTGVSTSYEPMPTIGDTMGRERTAQAVPAQTRQHARVPKEGAQRTATCMTRRYAGSHVLGS